MALAGLVLLGAAPAVETMAIPARDGVPAHMVRLRRWSPDTPGPHPLLVYEPGWNGSLDENTILMAALAKGGFDVVAIDLSTPQPPGFASQAKRLTLPMDLSSYPALARTTAEGDWRAVLMAGDASAVVDSLGQAAPSIGILGWSFGGAVALEACREDKRFAACLNMDGWMFGPATNPADELDAHDGARLRARFAAVGGIYAQIAGLQHTSFSDARGGNQTVRDLVLAFFTQTLLHQSQAILASDHPAPDVMLHRFNGG
jgi:dienelactone hydrolase